LFWVSETQFLTLREVCRLRVFENWVLRRIFGPRKVEVVGCWRKYHNELYNLYSLSNIIRMLISRRIWWVGHVGHMGGKGNVC
jgi:hypothetical protein